MSDELLERRGHCNRGRVVFIDNHSPVASGGDSLVSSNRGAVAISRLAAPDAMKRKQQATSAMSKALRASLLRCLA